MRAECLILQPQITLWCEINHYACNKAQSTASEAQDQGIHWSAIHMDHQTQDQGIHWAAIHMNHQT